MRSIDSFKRAAEALQPQLVAWRRDFHRHPELGFEEVRTAGIVADHLRRLGLEVSTGVGKTGVVAVIEPDRVPDTAPTVMLRFDMDALPIREANNVPYRSTVDGIMHACGHDGHTAIGMGVAQVLTNYRNDLPGRVKLVFQPAEEGLGGALAMIADGALESPKPAASFGLHLWSRIPLDQVIVQEGPLMAGADKIQLVVHGVGGHGAMPHETVDAVVVASEIVLAWQTVVSRAVNPTTPAVVLFKQGLPPMSVPGGRSWRDRSGLSASKHGICWYSACSKLPKASAPHTVHAASSHSSPACCLRSTRRQALRSCAT